MLGNDTTGALHLTGLSTSPSNSSTSQTPAISHPYLSEYQKVHDSVIQIALEKAKEAELKKKHPFTSIFISNSTSGFFSGAHEDEEDSNSFGEQKDDDTIDTSAINSITSDPLPQIFNAANGIGAPQGASNMIATTSKVQDSSQQEQKTVESMANSIVMGSFTDKDERKEKAQ